MLDMLKYKSTKENIFAKLLIATRNSGKITEFQELLSGISFQTTSLQAEGILEEVAETGESFEENATIKARTYSSISGLPTLADDSGLEVDALHGQPGIMSARYGGPGLSDMDRVNLLLGNLVGVPQEDRTARFRCVIAVAEPSGRTFSVAGVLEGIIIQSSPKGIGGFGYDPIFYVPTLRCTTAELSSAHKNAISHRGQAARRAIPLLNTLCEEFAFER